jgi:hypothetical protein
MARSPCRNAGLCLEHVHQTRLLLLGSRGRRCSIDRDAGRLVMDQMRDSSSFGGDFGASGAVWSLI